MNMSNLRDYLTRNGVKQGWLAKKLNISDSYLSLILSGDRVPPEWFEGGVDSLFNNKEKKDGNENNF